MLKAEYCLRSLDQAFSAWMTDLSQSGPLEDSVFVCNAEFGRTPKINSANGRNQWPIDYRSVLAGCGIAGDNSYGTRDIVAADTKEIPVSARG